MNRRTFFNFLGSAVIGTVIALKLPNSIAPIKIDGILKPISFSQLDKAFRQLCIGPLSPKSIYVSYNRLLELRALTEGYMQFHGARVKLDAYADDHSIYIEDPKYRRETFEGFYSIEV